MGDENMKICQFWRRGFVTKSQKYKERGNCPFSLDIIFKQNLENCIVIFYKYLAFVRIILDFINDTHRENCVLLCLLCFAVFFLTFFLCLHNQSISVHSVFTY